VKTVVAAALGECVHVAGVVNFLRLAEAAGWRTVFLGPAVSVKDVLEAARSEKAALVGISYRLTSETGERLLAEFAEGADDLRTAGVRFAFGGTPPVAERARAICKLVLFRVQFHSLDLVGSQQAVAKGPGLSPGHRLRQKQPQVATAAALLQIGGDLLARQRSGQVAQALPSLGVIRIKDDESGSALLVKEICAERDLTFQVVKQVAHVQWFVDTDVAAVVKLVGV
jgi:hypothetical protein